MGQSWEDNPSIYKFSLMDKCHFGIYVGSKIPHILRDAIDRAIKRGEYLNSSDFIRDAIKEKLQREGFVGEKESAEENSQGA